MYNRRPLSYFHYTDFSKERKGSYHDKRTQQGVNREISTKLPLQVYESMTHL